MNDVTVTGRLENWVAVEGRISGNIFSDVRQRFADDTSVTTSAVIGVSNNGKALIPQGAPLPGLFVHTKSGSIYLLGKPMTVMVGGEVTAETLPVDTLKPDDHDAGPPAHIAELCNTLWFHPGQCKVYRIHDIGWDAERNRWMIHYTNWISEGHVYTHLPEDFLREGRFIRVSDELPMHPAWCAS